MTCYPADGRDILNLSLLLLQIHLGACQSRFIISQKSQITEIRTFNYTQNDLNLSKVHFYMKLEGETLFLCVKPLEIFKYKICAIVDP